jgi:class 3 adenylate cyclase/tetratricopeptide (TPR) repeat protein
MSERDVNLSSERIICPTCGYSSFANQRFCVQCGAALSRTCPACRADNSPYHRFCSTCGEPIESAVIAPREERRWVTVLFADISGFTSMSERLDPEDVKILADRCAERLVEIVRRFGGTVINLVGDAVVAVFGAPTAHEDDAERAVRTGLAMLKCKLSDDLDHPIRIHVGINTGEVMAGLFGPKERRDYTVMGDMVNTAARLLSAAPPDHLLVGAETYRATQRVVHYRELQPIEAKGKEQLVSVWEALEAISMPQARSLGTAPLIGRDEELNHMLDMWARTSRDAQPHLVTIIGEPGIGKSRLSAEFERRLAPEVLVLHGRCSPYGEALTYGALNMMLKEAANITADNEAQLARAKLTTLVESLFASEDWDPDEISFHLALLTGLDIETDRARKSGDQRTLHMSARRFLEALSRHRPTCIIFDDLHWADDALLELIEMVASRVREVPLMIISHARPELLEKRPTWGRGVRSFTSLPLEPLNKSSERDLALALCRERGLPDSIVEQIEHVLGGNPLFAEEMVAMIAERGQVTGVPTLVKMLIAARLDTLPPGELDMLQLAAVFGKTFWKSGLMLLGAGSNLDIPDLFEALEQKDLLRAILRSQFRGDREYTFKHDLIRDVAYERLPRAYRRTLHGRVADWLEQAAGEQVDVYCDQLAHHAIEAGHQERAVDYLIRAAERASRSAAYRKAANLLGRAITIAESIAQRDVIADLHHKRGRAFMGVGMWEDARPELEAALETLAPELNEKRVLILLDLAEVRYWAMNAIDLRRYSTEALAIAKKIGRDDLAVPAIAYLSGAESSDGNLQASEDLYQDALLKAGGKVHAILVVPSGSGLGAYWLGRSADAISRAREAIESAKGDTTGTLYSLAHLGLGLAGAGQYTEASKVFDEARRFGKEYEIWTFLARAIAMSAGFHLDAFDYAGNEAIAEEALELGRSVNFPPPVVSSSIDLLFNFTRRQDIGRAEKLVDEVADTVEKAGGFHGWLWKIRLAEARAEIALARRDWNKTLLLADDAIGQSRARGRVKYHVLGLVTRGRALNALGRTNEAISTLKNAIELSRPTGDPALFLKTALALLDVEGDDTLAREAHAVAQRISAALPSDEMRSIFETAEPVQALAGLLK